ncbi:MAG: HEPN domain-containing protein [Anaerolineae bacterium]|jgi:HEPN domain-containing protein|nr:HEPN domain-containing protein [Anaerolineae bacterium]MDH7475086.1 HEPN domain-containing protein [Anaerolineae bacterium]
MAEGYHLQAQEWFQRGDHDLEMAQLLLDERGYTDTIAYLIQQGLEKYLKDYLVWHGERPPRTHDLQFLLKRAIDHDPRFEPHLDLCIKATRFYLEDRYPPGPPPAYDYAYISAVLEEAWQLVRLIHCSNQPVRDNCGPTNSKRATV